MAYTTINKSTAHFNTKLYTGNGSAGNAQTGVGFQPDLTWIKGRSVAYDQNLFDALRGTEKRIKANTNSAQDTVSGSVTAFGTDGFTVGADAGVNANSQTFASWNWKANGAGSANTAGTINSTVSANTTAGFSIVKYTGNGTSGATVGHGLGVAPKIVLIKKTSSSDNWSMLNTNISLNYYMKLNGDDAQVSDPLFNNTAPDTTKFTLDSDGQVNGNGNEFIAYCFAEVAGYSKYGSYSGNSNNNGQFIYTGMKVKFLLVKRTDTADWWGIFDDKREGYNQTNDPLFANTTDTEGGPLNMDLLSNGFKWYTSNNGVNGSGSYVYMAIGQSLVGSNNMPCTAR